MLVLVRVPQTQKGVRRLHRSVRAPWLLWSSLLRLRSLSLYLRRLCGRIILAIFPNLGFGGDNKWRTIDRLFRGSCHLFIPTSCPQIIGLFLISLNGHLISRFVFRLTILYFLTFEYIPDIILISLRSSIDFTRASRRSPLSVWRVL